MEKRGQNFIHLETLKKMTIGQINRAIEEAKDLPDFKRNILIDESYLEDRRTLSENDTAQDILDKC